MKEMERRRTESGRGGMEEMEGPHLLTAVLSYSKHWVED